jgi:hypothetical protein
MLNGAQPCKNLLEDFILEHQGIASGEDDIPDFGMLPNIVDSLAKLFAAHNPFGLADKALSCAVSAINGTLVCHKEKNTIRISMDDRRNRTIRVFAKRILRAVGIHPLRRIRNDLKTDRILRIRDQRAVIIIDSDGVKTFNLFGAHSIRLDHPLWRKVGPMPDPLN